MKHHIRSLVCAAALLAAMAMTLVACGGKQTMASKSASAFDDAKKKGIPIALDEHGGHSNEGAGGQSDHGAMPGMDHSKMAGMGHSAMAGMQHGTSAAGRHNMAGMDHSAMAGMDHSKMDHSKMAGMQHGSSMAGMQHGSSPSVPPVIAPPTSNAAIAQTQPAATLRSDEFDAPAPAAVDEAAKASGMKHSTEPPAQHQHGNGEAS